MQKKALLQKAWNTLIWNPEPKGMPLIMNSGSVNLEDPNVPLNGYTLGEVFGVKKTSAGENVTEKSSFNNSAVWRCVDIISGLIASLPVKPYHKTSAGREEMPKHGIYPLLTLRPSKLYSKTVFFTRALVHLLLWGNHVAKINRRRGAPNIIEGLTIIHPKRYKEIEQNSRGEYVYIFSDGKDENGEEKYERIKQDDVLHVPHLGDDEWGMGTIAKAREDIGLDFGTLKYGSEYFANGGHLHEYMSTDQTIPPDKLKEMGEYYKETKKEKGLYIATGGLKLYPQSVPPEDAQFLQTRGFQATTIARWFGVPPDKLADLSRATHSNIEHSAIAFLQDTIAPIIAKFENEYTYKLMDWEQGEYIEWNMDAYVRADSTAKANALRTEIQNAKRTPNEWRAMDNLPPKPGGDNLYLQKNMQKLEDFENGTDDGSGGTFDAQDG